MGITAPQAKAERYISLIGGGVELYGVHALDKPNRDTFGFGVGGTLAIELNFLDWLGAHVAGTAMWVGGRDDGPDTNYFGLMAGLRFHWAELLMDVKDDGWLDAHYNFGGSGSLDDSDRFIRAHGFDVGLGYEFALNESGSVRLGPFIRYRWGKDPDNDNPSLLMIGVSLGIGGRWTEGAEQLDTDEDGIVDAEDYCVTVPQGDNPDPERPGCPLGDTDGDGVFDADDVCPTVHHGPNPDPERPGCPLNMDDQDADGVLDKDDVCPTVHHGPNPDPERPGCPLIDTDNDGINDGEDQCPTVHKGPRPDPEKLGCPLPDRDGDTIPDIEDACPDKYGAPSTIAKRNGCPGLVQIKKGKIEINRPVYFATNKDKILAKSYPVLRAVADAIKASPWITKIRIEGHTDSRGRDEYNLELSQRRAASVLRALRKLGTSEGKLESEGYGETRPVESNNTPDGRAANRRVEFHIVSQE